MKQHSRFAILVLVLGAVALAAAPAAAADRDPAVASAVAVGKAFSAVARQAVPAVVFIRVERTVTADLAPGSYNDPFDLFNDDFFKRFFRHRLPERRQPRSFRQVGQGSGFLIDSSGLILTNHHVVGNADRITVRLYDGRELPGKLVGSDQKSDVALVRVEAKGLPSLQLGDSDRIAVGEWVVAIGNPFGLTATVTSGIVSAKGRTRVGITEYEDFIQTDAAINPGNSGGPLLNLAGEVIGINTAIFSRSGGYMGIGFAIPINLALSIRDQLLRDGKVVRGYLGVVVQDLTPDLAASFGAKGRRGALVAEVAEASPASAAGLQAGDVVLQVDGKPVEGSGTLRNLVAARRPGTRVELLVLRQGEEKRLTVTLGNLGAATPPEEAATAVSDEIGLEVGPVTADLATRFGYKRDEGVVVERVAPGSLAELAGIRAGALILSVDRRPVRTIDEFRRALAQAAADGTVLLRLREGTHARYVALTLDG